MRGETLERRRSKYEKGERKKRFEVQWDGKTENMKRKSWSGDRERVMDSG